VVVNLGAEPVALPSDGQLLLTSNDGPAVGNGTISVPTDTAAWVLLTG